MLALALGAMDVEALSNNNARRKKSDEEELLQLRSLVFEALADVIFHVSMDAQGRFKFTFANQKFFAATGLQPTQVIGKYVDEVIPEPSLSVVLGNYRKAVLEKKTIQWNETTVYPSGVRYGDVTIVPVIDSNGNCFSIVGTVHDITPIKEAENKQFNLLQEIHARNQLLETLIANVPAAIILSRGPDAIVQLMNPSAQKMSPFKIEVNRPLFEGAPHFLTGYLQQIKSGTTVNVVDREIDGRYFTYVRIPLRMEGEDCVLTMGHETTEEVVLRKQLEKEIDQRDDFIAIASHELRTPLTSLNILLQLIPKYLKDSVFPDVVSTLFQRSLAQLKQFSNLVDSLLDVTRIRANQIVLNREKLDLSQVVHKVVDQSHEASKDAGCNITEELTPVILGDWDPLRIEQVIMNLLSNAMKYGAGKAIHVSTRVESGVAKIVVIDEGIGIAKEDQEKIFNRFERVVPVKKYRGLGLGLYITSEIVRLHGGTISVESELGKGSKFTVSLPLPQENV